MQKQKSGGALHQQCPPIEDARYLKAFELIDAAHAQDPRKVHRDGCDEPYELYYSEKMSHYLAKRHDGAAPTLQLAVRAQHLRRWEVPRTDYPATKAGYFAWRSFLKKRQADIARDMCLESGLDVSESDRVAYLIRKENLANDVETQVLEDVACLTFLDMEFEDFEKQVGNEEKVIGIVRKTWKKMSEHGHTLALQIPMSGRSKETLEKALAHP